jgi:HlyD family secretion protein
MHKRLRIVVPIIVMLASATTYFVIFHKRANPSEIRISGNIDVIDSQLGFKIPGRLSERLVDEGASVKTGKLLARLDSADQELGVATAEANLALAQAALAELKAGSRPEDISRARASVDQARSRLEELQHGSRTQELADAQSAVDRAVAAAQAAQTQLDQAKSDYDRYTALFNEGVVSAAEYDRIGTIYKTAQSALDQAQTQVTSAKERLSLAQEGPRPEQIDQARAILEQAQAGYDLVVAGPRAETIDQAQARVDIAGKQVDQAKQQLEYTKLTAPYDGTVMSKAAEPGEYLNPGAPVVTIAELGRVYLRAYVNETDLGRVKLGQAVQVSTDSYPGKVYAGTVSYISNEAEFTPKSVQTSEERVKLVFLVKIELDNPNQELKPGMPADCVIQAEK